MTVLGLDVGANHTNAVVIHDGIMFEKVVGPTCFSEYDDPKQRISEVLTDIFSQVKSPVDAIGIGMTGFDLPGYRDAVHEVTQQTFQDVPVCVVHDGVTAQLGAFHGQDGLVVVAGTGIIGYGTACGRSNKVSGHGYLVGDEGGGLWIGREALRRSLRARDCVEFAPEWLESAICQHFQRDTLDEVNHLTRHQPQLLATIVPVLVRTDDDFVRSILEQAARHLADTMIGLHAKIGSPSSVKTALLGGVSNIDIVRARFAEELRSRLPGVEQCEALSGPDVGATFLFALQAGWIQ